MPLSNAFSGAPTGGGLSTLQQPTQAQNQQVQLPDSMFLTPDGGSDRGTQPMGWQRNPTNPFDVPKGMTPQASGGFAPTPANAAGGTPGSAFNPATAPPIARSNLGSLSQGDLTGYYGLIKSQMQTMGYPL